MMSPTVLWFVEDLEFGSHDEDYEHHLIVVMEDHWEVLREYTNEKGIFAFYTSFTETCIAVTEFRKAARYPTRVPSVAFSRSILEMCSV